MFFQRIKHKLGSTNSACSVLIEYIWLWKSVLCDKCFLWDVSIYVWCFKEINLKKLCRIVGHLYMHIDTAKLYMAILQTRFTNTFFLTTLLNLTCAFLQWKPICFSSDTKLAISSWAPFNVFGWKKYMKKLSMTGLYSS